MLASIISANHENDQMKGLAPDIKIMDLRILNTNGFSPGYLPGYYPNCTQHGMANDHVSSVRLE